MYWKVYLTFVNKVSALLINTQELWVSLTVCFWLASGINVPYMKYLPVKYLDDVGTYNVQDLSKKKKQTNKQTERREHQSPRHILNIKKNCSPE